MYDGRSRYPAPSKEARPIYRLIDKLYRLMRPATFLLDPETAHDLACRVMLALESCGTVAACEYLTPPDDKRLSQTIGKTYFPSPVGLAAGFDKTGELAHMLGLFGFGFVEAGTFTLEPRQGNPKPRLKRMTGSRGLANRMGWNNPGAIAGALNLYAKERLNPVGVNVGATPGVEDVDLAIESVVAVSNLLIAVADYLVVNPSCSNVTTVDFQSPSLLELLLRELSAVTQSKQILIKVAPETTLADLDGICGVCDAWGAGLIISNTLPSLQGALSAPLLYAGVCERIHHVYRWSSEVPTIACGGVETAAQVYELIRQGASLVQILTSWVYNGPFWPREINGNLSCLIRRDGFASISEARGTE